MGTVYPYTLAHFRERLELLESMNALQPGEREALESWIHEREQHATGTA